MSAPTIRTDEDLYNGLLDRAVFPGGVERWADLELVSGRYGGVLLWPKDRGGRYLGEAYGASVSRVEKGVARIMLCAEDRLPAGVDPGTRMALFRAQCSGDATGVSPEQADQIVQVGLFGEVLYR